MTTAEQLRTEGRVEGRAEVLIELLGLKFGPLSPDVLDAVNAASADQVTTWTRRLLTADTLDDVLR